MKTCKTVSIVVTTVVSMVGLFCISAQAQDLSTWVGKWFQITETGSGYEFDGSVMTKNKYKGTQYWKVVQWDEVNKILHFEITEYEDGWETFELDLNVIAGNDLDFLGWANIYNGGFAARIIGKKKEDELKSAKFTSLGGFNIGDIDENEASSLSFVGKCISDSKLPPDMPK